MLGLQRYENFPVRYVPRYSATVRYVPRYKRGAELLFLLEIESSLYQIVFANVPCFATRWQDSRDATIHK